MTNSEVERTQDAIAILEATCPVMASTLNKRVFWYLGLSEQIHTDHGAQFKSQLKEELSLLWKVSKTRTTSFHPQANGIVERSDRDLGDSLKVLLLKQSQEEWDELLPQLMRAYRGTPPPLPHSDR
ncbi:uncharacterized protein [Watersipora subatra]|uniref:uncharacterized protein n=1 Tax=Watersipora subatra TaxID=2589382 RepID=UPI00355B7DAE